MLAKIPSERPTMNIRHQTKPVNSLELMHSIHLSRISDLYYAVRWYYKNM